MAVGGNKQFYCKNITCRHLQKNISIMTHMIKTILLIKHDLGKIQTKTTPLWVKQETKRNTTYNNKSYHL